MGLLDQIFGAPGSDQSQAMGLLAAGLGRGDFSGGLLAANQVFSPDVKMKRELMQAQVDETRAQAQARQAALAEAQRQAMIQQQIPALYRGGGMSGGEAAPQTLGGVPMFSQPMGAAPMRSQPASFDVQGAVRLGMKPDDITKYAGLNDLGRQEVARTVNVPGPNGEKMVQQLDKFGQPVGKPMTEFEAAQFLNLGNRQVATIPRAGMQFSMGQSPDSVASNAVTRRGQDMVDARSRETNAQGKTQVVETPQGYMIVDKNTGQARLTAGPDGKPLQGKAADRQLTDSQAKANLFGSRMKESNEILSSLEGKYWPGAVNSKMAVGEVPVLGSTLGYAGNLMLTEEGQQAEQAQRDFLNATLRRESGAVISPSEFSNGAKQYFPQPGDSQIVLDQKRRNRAVAIRGMEAEVPGGLRMGPSANSPGNTGSTGGGWSIQKVGG
jgi:hypothetical protein